MLSISYEIDGRKINPKNLKNTLQKAMIDTISKDLEKRVQSIKCHEHHSGAKIKIKGKSLDKINIEISGCCDDLTERVKKKLY